MECWTVQRRVSAYLEHAVSEEERRAVREHLSGCRACTLESEKYSRLRETLRSLPQRTPPADLATRLRVAASRARMESAGGATRFSRWRDRFQLTLSNLMRPVALPAIGGLCSAVFLFSSLVPTFESAFAMTTPFGDVPTMLTTQPTLKCTAPVAFAEGDAVVDLRLDDQGRIIDYSIVSVPGQSEQLRRNIQNSLLFTEFWPATSFGRGVAGTIRISFRSSRIDVRG